MNTTTTTTLSPFSFSPLLYKKPTISFPDDPEHCPTRLVIALRVMGLSCQCHHGRTERSVCISAVTRVEQPSPLCYPARYDIYNDHLDRPDCSANTWLGCVWASTDRKLMFICSSCCSKYHSVFERWGWF